MSNKKIVVTSLSQVPLQYKEEVRKWVTDARRGYIKGMKMPGKGQLRIRVVIHQDSGPELLYGSNALLDFSSKVGYISPMSFTL